MILHPYPDDIAAERRNVRPREICDPEMPASISIRACANRFASESSAAD